MTAAAGYSGTPLPKKLGLKPGQAVSFVGLPEDLADLASAEPDAVVQRLAAGQAPQGRQDLVHAFFDSAAAYEAALPALGASLAPAGALWISWPKKAAKVPTDLTEDVVRRAALAQGLVDVKVCAVSDIWSGLKLVIPVAARGAVQ